jgi:large subunit ribosomal protein L35
MPKLKTKSGTKKRFKATASGKIKASQANKRHNMRRRSKRQIREQRGTTILERGDSKLIRQYAPYL